VFEKIARDLSSFGFNNFNGKNVLDLGCGQGFPISLLFAASGSNVTALDINYVKPDFIPVYFFKTLKTNGLKRAVKSLIERLLFAKPYYKQLETLANKELYSHAAKINFVVFDPTDANYPLPDNSYDLIISNAVLEHVSDVQKYFKAVSRLLKKNGVFYGMIHNFYSLSGGHNLQWAFPDTSPPSGIPPWDHLRENRFPTHVYLNHLKPENYKTIASSNLDIILFEGRDINHDIGGTEGEKFLTEELQNELSEFDRDLLLTRSYCIICKKK
jgi:SAM-dependent methyltransferase